MPASSEYTPEKVMQVIEPKFAPKIFFTVDRELLADILAAELDRILHYSELVGALRKVMANAKAGHLHHYLCPSSHDLKNPCDCGWAEADSVLRSIEGGK